MEMNNVNASVSQEAKPKKNSIGGSIAGAAAGLVTPTALQLPVAYYSLNKMSKLSRELPADTVQIVNEAGEKVLRATGLAQKGVTIREVTSARTPSEVLKSFFKKFKMDKIAQRFNGANIGKAGTNFAEILDPMLATKNGKNAFFHPLLNKIFINKEKLSLAQFHEIGHAYNYNNSKFWRAMQKLRMPAMLLPVGIALYAAISKKSEPKDGKDLSKGQKANNFIRNNADKLAFAATLPMLLEEGMASIRGCKWANKLLSPDIAKKVLKTNIGGYISYLGTAIALGIGAKLAKDVKDKIQDKKAA